MSRKVENHNDYLIRIGPFHYLHVLDTNANITRVETGPKNFTCLEHEKVVFGPSLMVTIPPRHYAVIDNPVIRKTLNGVSAVVVDEYGQAKLRHGDKEVRLEQDPFPLYPGEKLSGTIQPLHVVEENHALRLRATREFVDTDRTTGREIKRKAGDEWLFKGPGTYIPQVEVETVDSIKAAILKPNQALKVRAREDCQDHQNIKRKAGEEWLVRREGAYLPGVYEEIIETLNAIILTPKNAVHVRALRSTDRRKAGEEWLVTMEDTEAYIPSVDEVIVARINVTVLGPHEYCVISNPVSEETGKILLGKTKVVKGGGAAFFLKPGESLDGGIRRSTILSPDEALWVKAKGDFVDHTAQKRKAGNRWLVYGPGEYWPPEEVSILSTQRAFLKVEALGLYFFRPALFFLSILGLILLYLVYIKYF
eukprot:TRINITY_DN2037_c0_g1_i1.p1 TRINITY_DN2037_c0_g1~~TRINITY_DN2037_c0_g1_i1.p1  ORF type:complete len:422 (-),score=73.31 TRINITY_DN2037_c0_g1_i1:132-1397(-)